MSDEREGVRWIVAVLPHVCTECGAQIPVGAKFARYAEILAANSFGRHARILRDHCEECGRLLEDSLTTTEAVS